jgi:hypothetical protein
MEAFDCGRDLLDQYPKTHAEFLTSHEPLSAPCIRILRHQKSLQLTPFLLQVDFVAACLAAIE